MIVSDVGRIMYGSSNLELESMIISPSLFFNFVCVTIAHSFAKPCICSDSLDKYDCGINIGKYAF